MSSHISRRSALAGGVAALGAALGATSVGSAFAAVDTSAAGAAAGEETRSLAELYRDALAEGGKLTVYAGGDRSAGADALRAAFLADFPELKLNFIVDYSKFHDVRVDNQLATGALVPDVVQLQTLQDFTRWAEQGRLLRYRPAGFDKVHSAFKDLAGAWTALQVVAFSYMYDPTLADAPATPMDLVDPRWKGRIASSYPNDDDAVLYLYKLYADTYGWDWIARLAGQDPQFARGSYTPAAAVAARQKALGVGGSGSLTAPATSPVRWVAPAGHPFMAWGQRAAIFKDAAHPTAAKLYLNWQLSTARQAASTNGWSVRTDVTPAGGLKPIWTYPNANLDGFPRFMANRAEAERYRQTFSLYFSEVQGEPTPGRLGLRPGA
jgi:ABC-type Fe3+ transport system substrate-binding protein